MKEEGKVLFDQVMKWKMIEEGTKDEPVVVPSVHFIVSEHKVKIK